MSGKDNMNSSENENMCVVCFKNVDIYSIGICDHPVCYECSTRMRVLCRQNECPICRQDLPKVIFCYDVQLFRSLKAQHQNSHLFDRKFSILFETADIQRSYYKLLEHNCKICKGHAPFRSFVQLKDHMRREHELHYCDLCVSNLMIFTWERRCYTRAELGQHRRKGDVDDKSHRGHPLCEFCDTRYMDSDELFRHLRRDHLFCHFCDADGLHHYYPSYECLRQHFDSEHYLCEEGDCIHEKFTSVFRTDIDLKAHKASVHGKHLGKAASKQARTLELEFTLAPRPRPEQQSNRGANRKPQTNANNNQNQNERLLQEEGAVGYETYYTEPGGSRATQHAVTLTAQDFPSLGGGATNDLPVRMPSGNVTIRHTTRGQKGLARTNENFPALSADTSTVRFSVNSSTVDPREKLQSSSTTTTTTTTSNNTPNVSIHVNHRSNGAITTHISSQNTTNSVRVRTPRTDAFPALGTVTVPEAQWVKQNHPPKEPKPKANKVAAAPILPPRNSPTDFPSLSTSKNEPKPKKSTTVTTVPVWITDESKESSSSKSNNKSKKKKAKTNNNNNNHHTNHEPQTTNLNKTTSAYDSKTKITDKLKETIKKETQQQQSSTKQQQNGVVKKRSELKIDSLQIREPCPSNGYDDFPSLTPSTSSSKAAPSISKPPPGFTIQAPPGFAANDLTFTNSTGQSYSIFPCHQFSPPPNFTQRNKNLVDSFQAAFKTGESIIEFRNLSAMFRNGLFRADEYYRHCKEVMNNDFLKIFPELLVLLPDIEKQTELYDIHCKEDAGNKRGLEVCASCNQIVSSSDLRSHLATHTLQNHFPALGTTQEISSVWKK